MVTRVMQPEAPQPPAAAEGLTAELQALQDEAADVEGIALPGSAVAQQQQAEAASGAREEARQVVQVLATLAMPLVRWRFGPKWVDVYGERELQAIGDALGDVATKRGWSVSSILQGWGPELALCAAVAAPALPLLMAAAEAKKAPPAPAPQPQPQPQPQPSTTSTTSTKPAEPAAVWPPLDAGLPPSEDRERGAEPIGPASEP